MGNSQQVSTRQSYQTPRKRILVVTSSCMQLISRKDDSLFTRKNRPNWVHALVCLHSQTFRDLITTHSQNHREMHCALFQLPDKFLFSFLSLSLQRKEQTKRSTLHQLAKFIPQSAFINLALEEVYIRVTGPYKSLHAQLQVRRELADLQAAASTHYTTEGYIQFHLALCACLRNNTRRLIVFLLSSNSSLQ